MTKALMQGAQKMFANMDGIIYNKVNQTAGKFEIQINKFQIKGENP